MAGATNWVRRALAELGQDAPDQEVKAYIQSKDTTVPENYISLALRKLRGRVIPARRMKSPTKQMQAKPSPKTRENTEGKR